MLQCVSVSCLACAILSEYRIRRSIATPRLDALTLLCIINVSQIVATATTLFNEMFAAS